MYLFYPAYPQKAISIPPRKKMLHPLFPALTACFPASVRVALTTRKDSIAKLPDHCLVDNGAKASISDIDKQWYIEIAYKRIKDYKGE